MPTIKASGLSPYTGSWSIQHVTHLLRRTLFGVNYNTIKTFQELGLDKSVDHIFRDVPNPEPPLNYDFHDDPNTPIGETWVDKPHVKVSGIGGARFRSLTGWTFAQMLGTDSILEKMILFWHNHFVVSNISDRRFYYRYITTIRNHALGNFRELTKEMTVDPCMLRFLNGNANKKGAPNENFARELLELFTIGKGEIAGPGDYTTYTESDIFEIARALTGWRDFGHNNENVDFFGSEFVAGRHDTGVKVLSHRFDNIEIVNEDEEEYKRIIDIIFQKDEVSFNIARDLYRFFLFSDITDEIEINVIEPMAQMIRDNDYVIGPALKALIRSEHFFSEEIRGCMIKSPMDFVLGLYNQFNIQIPTELYNQYRFWYDGFDEVRDMQMTYYDPPSVAGWKAYYQEPAYYRSWINTVTLPQRKVFTDKMANNGIKLDGITIKIDPLEFIKDLYNPTDVRSLINETSLILFSKPLPELQIQALKEILIPGLPDFEWTVEYEAHLNNPDDDDIRKSVESKLRSLITIMLRMPEYHLS